MDSARIAERLLFGLGFARAPIGLTVLIHSE